MSCIITYKGKQYSEEQFKEYFINNKNEFATSITKNKDVIDSFKRKMEAIDGVFKDSPELASIGTKAQYMQYLSTIFKTSKVKDIVYHGSPFKNIEKFNKSKFLKGEGAMAFGKGFYFTEGKKTGIHYSDPTYGTMYGSTKLDEADLIALKQMSEKQIEDIYIGKLYKVIINIKNPVNWELSSTEKRTNLKEGIYGDNDSVIHKSKGFTPLYGDKEEKDGLLWEKYENIRALKTGNFGAPDDVLTDKDREELIKRNKEIDNKLKLFEKYIDGETHYIIPEPEQIHILGSKRDIEEFKKYTESNKVDDNLDFDTTFGLGMSIAEHLKTLSKKQRAKIRSMIKDGRLKTKCK